MEINKIKVVDNLQLVNVEDIKPYFRNPRKNEKTVELLVKYIPKVGFNVPLVLDRNNVIVKGHSRYFASFKLGMKQLPVVYTDADDEQVKLDRIADNRIQEHSEWITEQLGHELDMLDMDDILDLNFDLESMGLGVDLSAFDMDESDEPYVLQDDTISDEERKARYEEYLAKQGVKESHIEKAEIKHQEVGKNTEKYYKFVCPDCGNIHFVRARDVWEVDESELN